MDLLGDRHLRLQHNVKSGVVLEDGSRDATLRHVRKLWGYDVSLVGIDADTGGKVYEWSAIQTKK